MDSFIDLENMIYNNIKNHLQYTDICVIKKILNLRKYYADIDGITNEDKYKSDRYIKKYIMRDVKYIVKNMESYLLYPYEGKKKSLNEKHLLDMIKLLFLIGVGYESFSDLYPVILIFDKKHTHNLLNKFMIHIIKDSETLQKDIILSLHFHIDTLDTDLKYELLFSFIKSYLTVKNIL